MRTRWLVLADTVAEVEAVGDKRGDKRALVDTLADTVAEVEAVKLGDTRGYANALVNTLHCRGGGSRRHTLRCTRTGGHSG